MFRLVWFVSLMFMPGVAWAAESANPVQDILTSVMQLVALVLAGLVIWAVKLLMARFKLQISDSQEEILRKGAKDAIYFAEEWAAKKYGADKIIGKGTEQLTAATTFLLTKIPGLDQKAAQDAIHAALGQAFGLGASGTTGTPSV